MKRAHVHDNGDAGSSDDAHARSGHPASLDEALTRRLRAILQGRSNESVATWSGVSAESVRRYLAGDPPPARFLTTLCAHEGISGEWLLNGSGPPKVHHLWSVAIRECPLPDLFAEVGRRLEPAIQHGDEHHANPPGWIGAADKPARNERRTA